MSLLLKMTSTVNRFLVCLAIAAIFLTSASRTTRAATVSWRGETWDDNYGNTALTVNGLDQLVVSATPNANNWAAAHFNTSPEFRAAPTQWIEIGLYDTADSFARKELWLEDETTSGPAGTLGGWLQFGGNGTNYKIIYNDYDADKLDDSTVNFSTIQSVDTGIARTVGERTLKVGRRLDGTIDFSIDGVLTHSLSSTQFNPNYFGDVYLSSRFQDTAFTNMASVPEPGTLALVGLAVVGLICPRRNSR